ncbi:MAG: dipeptidyl-peptidase 4, partial [Solirubrobacteraceae bacterium]|nr:dipeptidyl-peptidase 4 [Solirubrobacteraceae bacterium]
PDPTGQRVAFVVDRALHLAELDTGAVSRFAFSENPHVSYGLAEFVAAEEMDRHYGFQWSPAGDALLVAHVDVSPVAEWWIADAVDPHAEPRSVRYPAAGTDNAVVELRVIPLDGDAWSVEWDAALPYVTRFAWDDHGPLAVVQSRDQRRLVTLEIHPESGETTVLHEQEDDAWVELTPGVPARLADGRLVTADHGALKVAGEPVAAGLQVRAVAHVGQDIVFTANADPTELHVYRWSADGVTALTTKPGVHHVVTAGGAALLAHRSLEQHGARWTLNDHIFGSHDQTPALVPAPRLLTVGERDLRVALLLPADHEPGRKLPVLVDPYGGPGHQRVVKARSAYYEAQWFADQGFAVLIADNRGTPGRGRDFSTAIHGDLAGPPLEDQVDALHATAEIAPELDLERVAVRGWSFGGFLAALAVLRRPDVFHAAVAGAPVVDWRLYDTHYTERYLGTDADSPAYAESSPIGDAAKLQRPLMLIHGLVDDNVVAAHTLRFSRALTEAGRPHTFLPLTGVTHMTPQEAVSENLLLLQVDFLKQALGVPPDPGRS